MRTPIACETRIVKGYRVTVADTGGLVELTITRIETGRLMMRAGMGDIGQAWEQGLYEAEHMARMTERREVSDLAAHDGTVG